MSFEILETETNGTIIKVVGVGGAGGNAVNTMIKSQFLTVLNLCAIIRVVEPRDTSSIAL